MIKRALESDGRGSMLSETARSIAARYCEGDPPTYREVGELLGVSPQYARRIVDRGVSRLADPRVYDLLDRQGLEEGTRLWTAIEKKRHPSPCPIHR